MVFFNSSSKKKGSPKRLKLCPLINNPCLREGCMMYRRTITTAGYCGLASRDHEECFRLDFEEGEDRQ
jgi:hypothetical protein